MSEPAPVGRGEISFGELEHLQSALTIRPAPFPVMRTLHWVPKNTRGAEGARASGADDVTLVVAQEVLLGACRHVAQSLDRESGGFLLGNRYRCPTGRSYVIIDQFVEGEYTEADPVSLNFTHECWRRLSDQLDTTYFGKTLVGWYHSHPRMSIALSEHDVAVHERRFSEPWKFALVLEPVKGYGGFYGWRGGRLDQHNPVSFYELLRDDGRKSVIAWENHSGEDPVSHIASRLAVLNTKTVGAAVPPPVHPSLSHASKRPWAFIALATVVCLLGAVLAKHYVGGKATADPAAQTGEAQARQPTPTGQNAQPSGSQPAPAGAETTANTQVATSSQVATNTQIVAQPPAEESVHSQSTQPKEDPPAPKADGNTSGTGPVTTLAQRSGGRRKPGTPRQVRPPKPSRPNTPKGGLSDLIDK